MLTSHKIQVESPDAVRIRVSSINLQQLKYPSCDTNSCCARDCCCACCRLYIEHILSRPPQATRFPLVCSKAQDMTHDDRSGMACTLLVLYAFQTISFPSCDADTRSCELLAQCMA